MNNVKEYVAAEVFGIATLEELAILLLCEHFEQFVTRKQKKSMLLNQLRLILIQMKVTIKYVVLGILPNKQIFMQNRKVCTTLPCLPELSVILDTSGYTDF